MRCTSFCTAGQIDLTRLNIELNFSSKPHFFKDVLHQEILKERSHSGDVFYFSYGAVVMWGLEEAEEKQILEHIKKFEKETLAKPERDDFTFTYGDTMKIEEDEIFLESKNYQQKLAISYAIAQSVKLASFEESVNSVIEQSANLPQNLAKDGKVSHSRKDIFKRMGELFLQRTRINLSSSVLDVPEFFWENPELEPIYRKTAHYLDLSKRVDGMNKKLTVIHDFLEILSSELNHQHSSRLEITIIALIGIEILIEVFNMFVRRV
jgi:uncharacterized Rmd1/YagE family protein